MYAEDRAAYFSPSPASLKHENVEVKRPIPVRSQTVDSAYQPNLDRISSPADSMTTRTFPKGDYVAEERDFGTVNKAQSDNSDTRNGVERSDTGGSTGSVVAAMRNRYSSTVSRVEYSCICLTIISACPVWRDIPCAEGYTSFAAECHGFGDSLPTYGLLARFTARPSCFTPSVCFPSAFDGLAFGITSGNSLWR
jgi:hypothetical protein